MSSRIAERRRKRLLTFAGLVVVCFVILFFVVWWFFNASFLKITSIPVSGESVLPASSIEQAVGHDIAGKYLGLFSKSNIFLYPKKEIEKNLSALYPTLADVSVNAKNFHTIAVVVSERQPKALWCGGDVAASKNCVFLDANGMAYANAPQYSGNAYQTYFGAMPEGPLPTQFLTAGEFHSLFALVGAFQTKVATDTVESVFVDTSNDVHLTFSGGYTILFALHDDSGSVFQHFSLARTAAPFTSHALSDFNYIDLRFGDKVYYKLKQE